MLLALVFASFFAARSASAQDDPDPPDDGDGSLWSLITGTLQDVVDWCYDTVVWIICKLTLTGIEGLIVAADAVIEIWAITVKPTLYLTGVDDWVLAVNHYFPLFEAFYMALAVAAFLSAVTTWRWLRGLFKLIGISVVGGGS